MFFVLKSIKAVLNGKTDLHYFFYYINYQYLYYYSGFIFRLPPRQNITDNFETLTL